MDRSAPAPFLPIEFLSRDLAIERRDDGALVLQSKHPLKPYEKHIPALVAKWAAQVPDRPWLAQRRGANRAWVHLSYGEAKRQIDAISEFLLGRGFGPHTPIMILSGNSIEFALLTMAAMQARAPIAPVSPAYSLMSQAHAKLKYVFDLVQPRLLFVQSGAMYARALAALDLTNVLLVHVDAPPPQLASLPFSELSSMVPTDAVARSIAAIEPSTVAKLLFTSGSTGMPKAVINTQQMMCANLAMSQMARPPDPSVAAVALDWLPWNHTMGGNASLHGVLGKGGTTYIDEGKPLPGMFDETLRNLREVSPTEYANVPLGYSMLVTALERDEALAQNFFRNLTGLAYGGAALPDEVYQRLEALAAKYTGHRIPLVSAWGSTETAPTATAVHWASERVGLLGLPLPGVKLKLIPTAEPGRYELRVKGITVTPGYYRQPELTAQMVDDEGYYKIGDAGRFVDPGDPNQGIVFSGRVVEDFKLSNGCFVLVGTLRAAAIAAAVPVLQDAVICGHDRDTACLLGFPNLAGCQQLVGDSDGKLTPAELLKHPAVIERLRQGLAAMNRAAQGTTMRIERAMLLREPPSVDGHEITDKGYVNQRATLERRKDLVQRLYTEPADEEVIVIG